MLQHRLRLVFAGDAERDVVRFAGRQRGGVAFAIPAAGGAIGLRHRGEELVFQAAFFGQLHPLRKRLLRIVPRRILGRLRGVGDDAGQLRRGRLPALGGARRDLGSGPRAVVRPTDLCRC